MSYVDPQRLDRFKDALVFILDTKQGNGESEESLLLWLDGVSTLWEDIVDAQLFIDDLKFSIIESKYILERFK